MGNLHSFFSDAQNISKATDDIEKQNVSIEDTWLVNIPAQKNRTKESTTDYLFASTSLRFDSHVFAYYFGNAGKEYSTKFCLLHSIKSKTDL